MNDDAFAASKFDSIKSGFNVVVFMSAIATN